ncbi:hypothetical protein MPSEU_000328000 [Mayamaea pseudoterrestris]|nr:hypothetical protein MPSEU_000328000 [Mayamaea pseudoterrestris]
MQESAEPMDQIASSSDNGGEQAMQLESDASEVGFGTPSPNPSDKMDETTPGAEAANTPTQSAPFVATPPVVQFDQSIQSTPAPSSAVASTPRSSQQLRYISTPTTASKRANPKTPVAETTVNQILVAVSQTALIQSPQFRLLAPVKQLFQIFMPVAKEIDARNELKLRKLVAQNPDFLVNGRMAHKLGVGAVVPDGYTPLMAACHKGWLVACRILLEHEPEQYAAQQLVQTNISGHTPLHIAASKGHGEIVSYLKQRMIDFGIPLNAKNILNQSALAEGLLSPTTQRSRVYENLIKEELFDLNDPCIIGEQGSVEERIIVAPLNDMQIAFSEMPGIRVEMEDAKITYADDTKVIVGICDGHADGGLVSKFVSEHLPDEFNEQSLSHGDLSKSMEEAFLAVDDKLRAEGISGGSTCVTAVVTQDEILVANAGDSRCILIHSAAAQEDLSESLAKLSIATDETKSVSFGVKPLSVDHKPDLPVEEARIRKAGIEIFNGKVIYTGLSTSSLGMSRSFGDFEFKNNKDLPATDQAVTVMPEIIVHRRSDTDRFLVLACDGVFDVMSNEQVADFVVRRVEAGVADGDVFALARAADDLLHECLRLETRDNMSVVIIALQNLGLSQENDVLKARLTYE